MVHLWLRSVQLVIVMVLLFVVIGAPAPVARADESLDVLVAELNDILASPKDGTFHVSYEIKLQGQTMGAVFYQKEGRSRLDATTYAGDGSSSSVQIFPTETEGVWVVCSGQPAQEPGCESVTYDPIKPGETFYTAFHNSVFEGALEKGLRDLAKTDLESGRVERREIVGMDVLVYVFESFPPQEGGAELAFTDDGVIVLIRAFPPDQEGESYIQALEFSRDVSDSDFEPPQMPQ
ncbi:MAG: hypothetical protein HY675_22305 [Chloroflexi bacterium]|nr:hypothetical protein [Chloroflexota bacterium]